MKYKTNPYTAQSFSVAKIRDYRIPSTVTKSITLIDSSTGRLLLIMVLVQMNVVYGNPRQ